MDLFTIAVVISGFLLYSLISGRLQGTIVTAPLIFIVFGFVLSTNGFFEIDMDLSHSALHFIAELTLILVLFTDAARIELKMLRGDHNLPIRMLSIGLPLVVVAGTFFAILLFPFFTFWEAALLASLLAPTDAALGQAVVMMKIVPVRIRQAINIESGLNDGIILPAVLLFATFASAQMNTSQTSDWIQFGVLQIVLGPLVGMILGYIGARLLDTAAEHKWSNTSSQGIGIFSLAALTYVCAEQVGGNGFIATFVGGMVFGNTLRHSCMFLFEFMETEGHFLMLITFLLFGAVLLPEGIEHININILIYAVLSLTIIRIVPIMLSLIGTGIRIPTGIYLGWFGPRGLASILFVLLILKESDIVHHDQLLSVTVVTVALSALLHGVTAAPYSKYYGRYAANQGKCEENKSVVELPLRAGPVKTDDVSS